MIVRIFLMVVVLGGIVYAIHSLQTKGISPDFLFLDSGATSSFDTKDVSSFEWRAANKVYAYDRTPSGNWVPEKNEKTLNSLLSFLAQIPLNSVEQTGKPAIDIYLTIHHEKWRGTWDGLSFVWAAGPHKGQGAILSEKQKLVFFRGRFIFDEVRIDLCRTRVQEILFQAVGKNYDLVSSGHDWVDKNANAKKDSVFIEKWLTQLCKVNIRAVIDPSLADGDKSREALSLKYVDGAQINLIHADGNLFWLENSTEKPVIKTGLILDSMAANFDSLQKALLAPASP